MPRLQHPTLPGAMTNTQVTLAVTRLGGSLPDGEQRRLAAEFLSHKAPTTYSTTDLTTCYLLLATCYLLLATCYLLLATYYLLTMYSLPTTYQCHVPGRRP